MSDSTNEAEGVGAADPITGVTGGKDDLARDTQLPDNGVEDGDVQVEEDGGLASDEAAGDPETLRAEADTLITNDAVAGETVDPGLGDGNSGPTGGSPIEATPNEPGNELAGQDIDLDDER